MPDRFELSKDEWDDQKESYNYIWKCINCGHERVLNSISSPGEHSPDKDAELHEPGSLPPPIIKDPDKWENSIKLSRAEKDLVKACWVMVDSLVKNFTIHQVTYVWDIINSLKSYDINKIIKAAEAYVNLLDYEAIHGVEPGSYCGAEGNVTEIRQVLKQIKRKGSGI